MKWIALLLASGYLASAQAATINVPSCLLADVQAAVTRAAAGDTIQIAAGSCAWSGSISISGITLSGAGNSTAGTVITGGMVRLTKHSTRPTQLTGFRFTGTDQHFDVGGSPSGKPFIIANNYFRADVSSKLGTITTNGGLIHHNEFNAATPTNRDVFNIVTSENWSGAPTFGTQDSNGERNIYFEDNVFRGILETMPDGDAGSRLVIRYNRFIDSSIVFHGGQPTDSSPNGGTRQFEVYNNTFERVSNSAAINKWIWVRGSTGVIANNTMARAESPDGSSYPNKHEIFLTVGCPTGYPVQYQVGQSNVSPESPPSHPLAIFGNTGPGTSDSNFIDVDGSDTAGPSCATPNNYIQQGRDFVLSNSWGWTPYVYPHPLQSGQTTQVPAAPVSLTAL